MPPASAVAVLVASAFGAWGAAPTGCEAGDDPPVRVTVVVVLATAADAAIDDKLADLAKEVRKRNPALTGFKIAATLGKSIPVGDAAEFELVEKAVLKVKAERPKDADGRISLTVKPPGLGEVTYACACDKFFPVVTPYKTAGGETLIVAVMAKPCGGKKDKD